MCQTLRFAGVDPADMERLCRGLPSGPITVWVTVIRLTEWLVCFLSASFAILRICFSVNCIRYSSINSPTL